MSFHFLPHQKNLPIPCSHQSQPQKRNQTWKAYCTLKMHFNLKATLACILAFALVANAAPTPDLQPPRDNNYDGWRLRPFMPEGIHNHGKKVALVIADHDKVITPTLNPTIDWPQPLLPTKNEEIRHQYRLAVKLYENDEKLIKN
jgi:hypothetical protein